MGNRAYGAGYKEGYRKAMEELSKNKKNGCFGIALILFTISISLVYIFK